MASKPTLKGRRWRSKSEKSSSSKPLGGILSRLKMSDSSNDCVKSLPVSDVRNIPSRRTKWKDPSSLEKMPLQSLTHIDAAPSRSPPKCSVVEMNPHLHEKGELRTKVITTLSAGSCKKRQDVTGPETCSGVVTSCPQHVLVTSAGPQHNVSATSRSPRQSVLPIHRTTKRWSPRDIHVSTVSKSSQNLQPPCASPQDPCTLLLPVPTLTHLDSGRTTTNTSGKTGSHRRWRTSSAPTLQSTVTAQSMPFVQQMVANVSHTQLISKKATKATKCVKPKDTCTSIEMETAASHVVARNSFEVGENQKVDKKMCEMHTHEVNSEQISHKSDSMVNIPLFVDAKRGEVLSRLSNNVLHPEKTPFVLMERLHYSSSDMPVVWNASHHSPLKNNSLSTTETSDYGSDILLYPSTSSTPLLSDEQFRSKGLKGEQSSSEFETFSSLDYPLSSGDSKHISSMESEEECSPAAKVSTKEVTDLQIPASPVCSPLRVAEELDNFDLPRFTVIDISREPDFDLQSAFPNMDLDMDMTDVVVPNKLWNNSGVFSLAFELPKKLKAEQKGSPVMMISKDGSMLMTISNDSSQMKTCYSSDLLDKVISDEEVKDLLHNILVNISNGYRSETESAVEISQPIDRRPSHQEASSLLNSFQKNIMFASPELVYLARFENTVGNHKASEVDMPCSSPGNVYKTPAGSVLGHISTSPRITVSCKRKYERISRSRRELPEWQPPMKKKKIDPSLYPMEPFVMASTLQAIMHDDKELGSEYPSRLQPVSFSEMSIKLAEGERQQMVQSIPRKISLGIVSRRTDMMKTSNVCLQKDLPKHMDGQENLAESSTKGVLEASEWTGAQKTDVIPKEKLIMCNRNSPIELASHAENSAVDDLRIEMGLGSDIMVENASKVIQKKKRKRKKKVDSMGGNVREILPSRTSIGASLGRDLDMNEVGKVSKLKRKKKKTTKWSKNDDCTAVVTSEPENSSQNIVGCKSTDLKSKSKNNRKQRNMHECGDQQLSSNNSEMSGLGTNDHGNTKTLSADDASDECLSPAVVFSAPASDGDVSEVEVSDFVRACLAKSEQTIEAARLIAYTPRRSNKVVTVEDMRNVTDCSTSVEPECESQHGSPPVRLASVSRNLSPSSVSSSSSGPSTNEVSQEGIVPAQVLEAIKVCAGKDFHVDVVLRKLPYKDCFDFEGYSLKRLRSQTWKVHCSPKTSVDLCALCDETEVTELDSSSWLMPKSTPLSTLLESSPPACLEGPALDRPKRGKKSRSSEHTRKSVSPKKKKDAQTVILTDFELAISRPVVQAKKKLKKAAQRLRRKSSEDSSISEENRTLNVHVDKQKLSRPVRAPKHLEDVPQPSEPVIRSNIVRKILRDEAERKQAKTREEKLQVEDPVSFLETISRSSAKVVDQESSLKTPHVQGKQTEKEKQYPLSFCNEEHADLPLSGFHYEGDNSVSPLQFGVLNPYCSMSIASHASQGFMGGGEPVPSGSREAGFWDGLNFDPISSNFPSSASVHSSKDLDKYTHLAARPKKRSWSGKTRSASQASLSAKDLWDTRMSLAPSPNVESWVSQHAECSKEPIPRSNLMEAFKVIMEKMHLPPKYEPDSDSDEESCTQTMDALSTSSDRSLICDPNRNQTNIKFGFLGNQFGSVLPFTSTSCDPYDIATHASPSKILNTRRIRETEAQSSKPNVDLDPSLHSEFEVGSDPDKLVMDLSDVRSVNENDLSHDHEPGKLLAESLNSSTSSNEAYELDELTTKASHVHGSGCSEGHVDTSNNVESAQIKDRASKIEDVILENQELALDYEEEEVMDEREIQDMKEEDIEEEEEEEEEEVIEEREIQDMKEEDREDVDEEEEEVIEEREIQEREDVEEDEEEDEVMDEREIQDMNEVNREEEEEDDDTASEEEEKQKKEELENSRSHWNAEVEHTNEMVEPPMEPPASPASRCSGDSGSFQHADDVQLAVLSGNEEGEDSDNGSSNSPRSNPGQECDSRRGGSHSDPESEPEPEDRLELDDMHSEGELSEGSRSPAPSESDKTAQRLESEKPLEATPAPTFRRPFSMTKHRRPWRLSSSHVEDVDDDALSIHAPSEASFLQDLGEDQDSLSPLPCVWEEGETVSQRVDDSTYVELESDISHNNMPDMQPLMTAAPTSQHGDNQSNLSGSDGRRQAMMPFGSSTSYRPPELHVPLPLLRPNLPPRQPLLPCLQTIDDFCPPSYFNFPESVPDGHCPHYLRTARCLNMGGCHLSHMLVPKDAGYHHAAYMLDRCCNSGLLEKALQTYRCLLLLKMKPSIPISILLKLVDLCHAQDSVVTIVSSLLKPDMLDFDVCTELMRRLVEYRPRYGRLVCRLWTAMIQTRPHPEVLLAITRIFLDVSDIWNVWTVVNYCCHMNIAQALSPIVPEVLQCSHQMNCLHLAKKWIECQNAPALGGLNKQHLQELIKMCKSRGPDYDVCKQNLIMALEQLPEGGSMTENWPYLADVFMDVCQKQGSSQLNMSKIHKAFVETFKRVQTPDQHHRPTAQTPPSQSDIMATGFRQFLEEVFKIQRNGKAPSGNALILDKGFLSELATELLGICHRRLAWQAGKEIYFALKVNCIDQEFEASVMALEACLRLQTSQMAINAYQILTDSGIIGMGEYWHSNMTEKVFNHRYLLVETLFKQLAQDLPSQLKDGKVFAGIVDVLDALLAGTHRPNQQVLNQQMHKKVQTLCNGTILTLLPTGVTSTIDCAIKLHDLRNKYRGLTFTFETYRALIVSCKQVDMYKKHVADYFNVCKRAGYYRKQTVVGTPKKLVLTFDLMAMEVQLILEDYLYHLYIHLCNQMAVQHQLHATDFELHIMILPEETGPPMGVAFQSMVPKTESDAQRRVVDTMNLISPHLLEGVEFTPSHIRIPPKAMENCLKVIDDNGRQQGLRIFMPMPRRGVVTQRGRDRGIQRGRRYSHTLNRPRVPQGSAAVNIDGTMNTGESHRFNY